MTGDGDRATILIVDDYPPNVFLLGEGLMEEHDVIVATSGAEALSLAASAKRPDLILLDILMPGMDGFEVCRRLKAEPWTRSIPVIFISAKDAIEDEARGLELGAVDYITRPFSIPIVRARVRTHVELKRHRDLLESLSMRDGLTGIGNRRAFDQHYDMLWRQAQRENTPLSVIMADMDKFKAFNDQYGHLAGDDCLRRVAGALASSLQRPMDRVARYGGEEFACILPDTAEPGAFVMAETLRAQVEALGITHEGSTAGLMTISLGVATCVPSQGERPDDLLGRADRALYAAKSASRNVVKQAGPEGLPTAGPATTSS